jgi:hypothetical protein
LLVCSALASHPCRNLSWVRHLCLKFPVGFMTAGQDGSCPCQLAYDVQLHQELSKLNVAPTVNVSAHQDACTGRLVPETILHLSRPTSGNTKMIHAFPRRRARGRRPGLGELPPVQRGGDLDLPDMRCSRGCLHPRMACCGLAGGPERQTTTGAKGWPASKGRPKSAAEHRNGACWQHHQRHEAWAG